MANNLEDLNRQIEEQQQKVLKAEEHYSSVKNNLSKLGEDYYKTTMLTIKDCVGLNLVVLSKPLL